MSQQIYNWKRFWSHPTGRISLNDGGGYLDDPDSEQGRSKICNPDVVTLDQIAEIPCLVLLGEPGIGKSQEMQNLVTLTKKNLNLSNLTLERNLRSCSLADLIQEQAFIDWINGSHRLYLFLDSLDEGLLEIRNLATQLVDEFGNGKYNGKLDRLYLRIACRTFVFPEILENGLEELWQKKNLGIYELIPLRRIDVMEAARIEGLDPNNFVKEVGDKYLVPLAIKPITLKFLLNIYHQNDGQFPLNQRLYELYLEGCKILCGEFNQSRRSSKRIGNLDSDQRLVVAARIASITIFANRFAVWDGIDLGNVPNEDVFLQKLTHGYENANCKSFEINREVIEETLDTGLFSSRGQHRMGWAHQTYSECLAAWYLVQHKISLPLISRLFFSSEGSEHKLIPQLHETAAWLASMREDFLQEIIKTDPDVILRSDVTTDAKVRAAIVDNLLKLYEQEKIFDRYSESYYRYVKLKHPELASQLRPYISNSRKQIDARNLAIDIANVCEVSELQEELVNLALDSSQLIHLRVNAAKALLSIGDSDTKLKLMPLAINQLPEDEDDRLKGYAMQALWSDHLSADELFKVLTQPKKRNFVGSYQIFIDHYLVPKLQPDDLVIALKWLKKQGVRCFGHPFEKLGNSIVLKAWENFDLPKIVEFFAEAALVQWKEYQPIVTRDSGLQTQFISSLTKDTNKRRKLIEYLVATALGDLDFIFSSSTENILMPEDFLWIIKRFQNTDSQTIQSIWMRLIQCSFNPKDVKHIDAIITAIQNNDAFPKEFALWFEAVELNSDRAETMRAYYIETQSFQNNKPIPPTLDPLPKQKIIELLDQLETGDLEVWGQLNIEMTHKPDSLYHDNNLELDLTKLSGWQEAEEITRKRIIEGAKNYIQQKWIYTNTLIHPVIADCRALHLLVKESPDFLDACSSEIWKNFASAMISTQWDNPSKDSYLSYLEAIRLTYLYAPQESIDTLLRLIDKENEQYDYILVINCFEKCWDKQLKDALLKKVKDGSLKTKCIDQLLEKLLKHGSKEARDYTQSLISFPLSPLEHENEKTLIASRLLVENSDPSSWSYLWSLIQQDISFGRKVFELASYRCSYGIDLQLTEKQLADLYIWLVQQYPFSGDPDYSNQVLAHFITNRETVANLRDHVLSRLTEAGTCEACTEIERLIKELPNIAWLNKTLLKAKKNMHQKSWQPMKPEEIIQLLVSPIVSNTEIADKIDQSSEQIKRMSAEPKKIDFSNSQINAPLNINASNSGTADQRINDSARQNDDQTRESAKKKQINWTLILPLLSIFLTIVGIFANGLFNDEIKQNLFKKNPSPPIQEKSSPNSSQPR